MIGSANRVGSAFQPATARLRQYGRRPAAQESESSFSQTQNVARSMVHPLIVSTRATVPQATIGTSRRPTSETANS